MSSEHGIFCVNNVSRDFSRDAEMLYTARDEM
jgi:hypothetical protein